MEKGKVASLEAELKRTTAELEKVIEEKSQAEKYGAKMTKKHVGILSRYSDLFVKVGEKKKAVYKRALRQGIRQGGS